MESKDLKIGFVGQGFVGKSYADDFESRGFEVIRYALEQPYRENKEDLKKCDIVFIAVPTPTTPDGFDMGIVKGALALVSEGSIAVIKSTILPGTTEMLQKQSPKITVLHSPEFLTRATALEDVKNPVHNIVGVPEDSEKFREAAKMLLSILPKASSEIICLSKEAELFKYLRNCFFYTKVIYMNMLYDFAEKLGCKWETLREIMLEDPWIANKHLEPVDQGGRGAGGDCFIKDFKALSDLYESILDDEKGGKILRSIEEKNIELLKKSNKDLDLLTGVYGKK